MGARGFWPVRLRLASFTTEALSCIKDQNCAVTVQFIDHMTTESEGRKQAIILVGQEKNPCGSRRKKIFGHDKEKVKEMLMTETLYYPSCKGFG